MKKTLNAISGILFLVAYLPYIWAIVHGQTSPSPVSWAIWAGVDTLALLAMKKKNALNGQIIGAACGAWIIAGLAIFYGQPNMGSIEWVSIAGAVAGIVLWKKTGNAATAIICSQIAVFAGAIPTWVSGYYTPGKEDPVAWTIWTVSCFLTLFAIKKWDLDNALQPITFTLVETTMVVLIVIRPHLL